MLKKIAVYLVVCIYLTACSSNKKSVIYENYSNLDSSGIRVCFTPPTNICGNQIVDEINSAKKSIYVQAYGLTHQDIINALVTAQARGVDVRLITDKSNIKQHNHKINMLAKLGIEVVIDRISGIAHNKVMIIDNQTVITGSFNFTKAADTRNAENVVFICNNGIANQYLNNWRMRHSNSYDFRPW